MSSGILRLVCVLGLAGCVPLSAQGVRPLREEDALQVLHVQGNVHVLAGPEGNTTVQIGEHGVLVVDPQSEKLSEAIMVALRTLSDKPIHYIINTQADAVHNGGNERLARLGPTRPDRLPLAASVGGNNGDTTSIIAHENVLKRMSGLTRAADKTPEGGWPTDTYFGDNTEVFFNGEAVQILHQPAAHTDGDSIVFFRRSDVIVAGDLFLTTTYPVIDGERGGHVDGLIAALNRIIKLAIPTHNQEGGTMVIPGHGRVCDEMDVVEYRNMLTIVRDRIQRMIGKGMTLEQTRAARPTTDFDTRYGVDTGPWTTSMFIEAIYRNLSPRSPTAASGATSN